MFALFPAQLSEVDACYDLIDQGRAFQRKQGFVQWTPDYPQREHVAADIEARMGYALKDEAGRIAGYICIDFGGEPAYDAIKGQWRSKEPSGVCTVWLSVPTIADRGWAAYFCLNVNGSVKKRA